MGSDFLAANKDNEKGFWEHRRVVEMHEELLRDIGSSWDDTRLLPDKWWLGEKIKPYRLRIREIIEEDFGEVKLWSIKDPRMVPLLPLWLEIFAEMEITPLFLIAWRMPENVALSLNKRDGFSPEKSLLLWTMHNLEAEKWTRGKTRVFLQYDKVMENWRTEFSRVAATLGLTWPKPQEAEIDALISPELRHHSGKSLETTSRNIEVWAEKTASVLATLSHTESAEAFSMLDAVHEEIAGQDENSREFMSLWYGEALRLRKELLDSYTAAHEKNLTIGQLGTELHERNLALIKTNDEMVALSKKNTELYEAIEALNREIRLIISSLSWRITAPLRNLMRIWIEWRFMVSPRSYMNAYRIVRNFGLSALLTRIRHRIYLSKDQIGTKEMDYQEWIARYDTLTPEKRGKILLNIKNMARKPLISVVMPVYNVEEAWLRAAIESVLDQIYPHLELCIADDCSSQPHVRKLLEHYAAKDNRVKLVFRQENGHISEASNSALALAQGEFVALMDHDDLLPAHALYHVAREINAHPDVDLIYSDEDKIDITGRRYSPYFKGDFDIDALFARNTFSHLGVFRRELLEKIGGFRKGFEGSQDYDLLLRCLAASSPKKVRHIPHILYHWRAISGSTAVIETNKNYALEAGRKALAEYFAAIGENVKIEDGMLLGFNRIVRPLGREPKAAIIIPTRNGYHLLRKCIESIKAKTEYKNYEIIIIDNQSDDELAKEYFKALETEGTARIIPYDAPFNYSAINNMAAQKTIAEILVFMNNDIEIISPGWLGEMAAQALREDIGAVGAKLYYPNDTIQHAGVMTGFGAKIDPVAGHLFHTLPRKHPGYFGRLTMVQSLSAVTAALLVMRKAVFEEIGGFDETHLTVAFNDVDLCLRIAEKGYRILWTPYAEAYHHESATRGSDLARDKIERFKKEIAYMRKRWGKTLDKDPYYNPNLDMEWGNFTLAFPPRVRD